MRGGSTPPGATHEALQIETRRRRAGHRDGHVQRVQTGTDVDAIEDDRADGLDQPRAAVPVTGGSGRPRSLPEIIGGTH